MLSIRAEHLLDPVEDVSGSAAALAPGYDVLGTSRWHDASGFAVDDFQDAPEPFLDEEDGGGGCRVTVPDSASFSSASMFPTERRDAWRPLLGGCHRTVVVAAEETALWNVPCHSQKEVCRRQKVLNECLTHSNGRV